VAAFCSYSPFFEIALVLVRLDHMASFTFDDLGASDFYLHINQACCLISVGWAAGLVPSKISTIVLVGTAALHTAGAWGAVILKSGQRRGGPCAGGLRKRAMGPLASSIG